MKKNRGTDYLYMHDVYYELGDTQLKRNKKCLVIATCVILAKSCVMRNYSEIKRALPLVDVLCA